MEVKVLKIHDIVPNPVQPREVFNKEKLKELAGTISDIGILQPIVVRSKGNKYEIIAGERRWKASQIAGKTTIPAIIRNIPDEEVMIESLIENIHRENLGPEEEARAILEVFKEASEVQSLLQIDDQLPSKINIVGHKIRNNKELSEEEKVINDVVNRIGYLHVPIYNSLSILNLPRSLLAQAREKKIGKQTLASIGRVKDEKAQKQIFDKAVREKLPQTKVQKLTKLVKKAPEPIKEAILKPNAKLTPEMAEEVLMVEDASSQKAIMKKIELENLTEPDVKRVTTLFKNKRADESVKQSILKSNSRITPEMAEKIIELEPMDQERVTQMYEADPYADKENIDFTVSQIKYLRKISPPKTNEEEEKRIAEIGDAIIQAVDETERLKNGIKNGEFPETARSQMAFKNVQMLFGMMGYLKNTTCPQCGKGPENLVWECCDLKALDSVTIAEKAFTEANKKAKSERESRKRYKERSKL